MDQRRDRGRAFHGVGQPGVQQELRRFAHGPHEQPQADQRQRVDIPVKQMNGLADERRRLRENGVEVDAADHREEREDTEREAEIADAVDEEGLDRRGVGFRLVVPEADQQVTGEPDAFPAEEHLHQIVRRHQHQHGEGEHRQIAEEARAIRVLLHVADGVEVHKGRHRGHDHQHHCGQRVDAQRPVDLQIARRDPSEDRHAHVVVVEADVDKGDPRQDHRHHQQRRSDELGRARAGGGGLVRGVVVVRSVRRRPRAMT